MRAQTILGMLAIALSLSLCACAPTTDAGGGAVAEADEATTEARREREEVRALVEDELSLLRSAAPEDLASYLSADGAASMDSLASYGIDALDLLEHLLGRFSYVVEDVNVAGDEARVRVRVENVDVSVALDAARQRLASDEYRDALAQYYVAGDEQGLTTAVMDVIYVCLDETSATAVRTVELVLTRGEDGDGGQSWMLDEPSLDALMAAIYGNVL